MKIYFLSYIHLKQYIISFYINQWYGKSGKAKFLLKKIDKVKVNINIYYITDKISYNIYFERL